MVIWTPRARTDLKAIYQHVYKDSPLNAKSITERILARTANLAEFPGTHKVVPESQTPGCPISKLYPRLS